ncbi:DUF441 domain-containing protein [Paenibacillus sp. TRM 82003]|nr:DUF441 domain-containing protein [Paenibacillus sp. TRM 82003]
MASFSELLLITLIMIGILGRSRVITNAACVLLIIKLLSLERLFPILERRGLELGLILLTIGVLVPFASGRIAMKDVTAVFTSVPGILALAGGALTTYTNREGLELLSTQPELIVGLVIGSIFGIVFMRGVPAGPLMAAGITALFMKISYTLLGL